MLLHCEKCHNVLGETILSGGRPCVRIRLAVRGRKRRTIIAEGIQAVTCEECGHEGLPLPKLVEGTAKLEGTAK